MYTPDFSVSYVVSKCDFGSLLLLLAFSQMTVIMAPIQKTRSSILHQKHIYQLTIVIIIKCVYILFLLETRAPLDQSVIKKATGTFYSTQK